MAASGWIWIGWIPSKRERKANNVTCLLVSYIIYFHELRFVVISSAVVAFDDMMNDDEELKNMPILPIAKITNSKMDDHGIPKPNLYIVYMP
jgi:hypothetical protein